jgi:hypothetical protein
MKKSVAIVSTSVGRGVPGAWAVGDEIKISDMPSTRFPAAYAEWAKQGDLIVAGDVNTDPELGEYVASVGGEYLTPDAQREWPFSEAIGWRCIQRRNAAVMTAYARGYDYVVTTDDDNTPTSDWVAEHVAHLRGELPPGTMHAIGDDTWVDTGQFNAPPTRQRGTPYGSVRWHTVRGVPTFDLKLVVSTAQVLGEPDCDAVTRIAHGPHVTGVKHNVVVAVDQYAAFNSQATLWDGRWAPLMACLPGVGRYDDIVASFVAKRIMRAHNATFYCGEPCVTQDRNPHNYASDLRREIWGMDHAPHVVRALDRTMLTQGVDLIDAYEECTEALGQVLPPQATRFMYDWIKSWKKHVWY